MTSENRKSRGGTKAAFAICVLLAVFLTSPTDVQGLESSYSNLSTGPYVDEVIFRVIANQDQRVLALLSGEIEMDNSFFDPVFLPELDADPDIDIYTSIRNGYGHITINCERYPLNISGFRRAFAFAFDKTRVTEEILDGFGIEHDSLVPRPNGWCIEDQFDYHYYTEQSDIGNQILDVLNFTIDAETGFRLTPDGTPFEIAIKYAASSPEIAGGTAQIAVDALRSLGVKAETLASTFEEYGYGPLWDFDMVFYAVNFYSNDVDWLAYSYWSEYAGDHLQNPTNFRNVTYDSWRDQLLYGTTYETVYEASSEMQKILHYNVPRLVVYANTYMYSYRNDQFTGHVEDLDKNIAGPWTMRKIHNLDGTFGGSVSVAIGRIPDSFNFFVSNSVDSAADSAAILSELWPSLYKYGPDLKPWPDLAESVLTETHSDNPEVPEGHTRFTIDIVRNATWSDGTPITGTDVAFSIIYAFESADDGNPAGSDIGDLFAAYIRSTFSVIFEFSTESYWHFSNFAFDYIIPFHIFNDDTGIGYEDWNIWNPVLDPAEPNVNCGPFIFSDYEAGEYYKIERNLLFHYAADPTVPITDPTSTPTTVSTITTGNTNESIGHEMNWSLVFSFAIGSGSTIVILFCLVIIVENRRNIESI